MDKNKSGKVRSIGTKRIRPSRLIKNNIMDNTRKKTGKIARIYIENTSSRFYILYAFSYGYMRNKFKKEYRLNWIPFCVSELRHGDGYLSCVPK